MIIDECCSEAKIPRGTLCPGRQGIRELLINRMT